LQRAQRSIDTVSAPEPRGLGLARAQAFSSILIAPDPSDVFTASSSASPEAAENAPLHGERSSKLRLGGLRFPQKPACVGGRLRRELRQKLGCGH
jgi:hypothetical protein